MDDKIVALKKHICVISSKDNFIHHKWFVNWHLNIVEKTSLELCEIYKDADLNLVLGLVWMHDYAKIIDYDNEHAPHIIAKGKRLLENLKFEDDYISKLMSYIDIFESYMTADLNEAPIEVKIVSSADAASHMVGPFFPIYWYEHPEKSIDELSRNNQIKLRKDWERKMVLPEIRESFRKRYEVLREITGTLPPKLLHLQS